MPMKNPPTTNPLFKTVLGACKGTPRHRIWIEGKRLVASGFVRGARYQRIVVPECITLTLDDEGTYKVSGKDEKPIIDITGAYVAHTFPQGKIGRAHV